MAGTPEIWRELQRLAGTGGARGELRGDEVGSGRVGGGRRRRSNMIT